MEIICKIYLSNYLVCTHPYLRPPAPSILYPKSVIRVYDRIVFVPIRWVTSLAKA